MIARIPQNLILSARWTENEQKEYWGQGDHLPLFLKILHDCVYHREYYCRILLYYILVFTDEKDVRKPRVEGTSKVTCFINGRERRNLSNAIQLIHLKKREMPKENDY